MAAGSTRLGRKRPQAMTARTLRVLIGSALIPVATGFFGAGASIGPDLPALANALGASAHCVVAPEDMRWEASEGGVDDLLHGRKMLFLGRPAAGAPRDVYRARVRLSWEGRPLEVAAVYNLTSTPLGDDHALVVRGARAAFATAAFGQEQSVTMLDLAGAAAPEGDGLGARAMRWLTNVQEVGEGVGLKRVDATIDPPGRKVGLALGDAALAIDVEHDRAVHRASLDYASLEAKGDAAMLKVETSSRPTKKLVHWAVDTVRAVPWIGPAPIAWLEERAFAMRDTMRKTAFELRHSDAEVRADARAIQAAPVLASALGDRGEDAWPPQNITSIWKTPEAGEGEWVAPKIGWIKKLDLPGAPPAFMRTFVRPDEQRPYARVLLVAMDTRRMDLEMEAGSEDPKPLVGPAGPGRLPRDPAIATRVVGAFNGAFKTEHGFHGMMVKKRVLLPPQPNAATVVILKDGRAGLGTWGPAKDIVDLRGVPASEIVSLRQNLDPLVDQGEINPQKRGLWGFTLPGTSMQTERSGICVTAAGHLFYAWGDDVSGLTLAKGMKMAGCTYGMHLDMNPHHTGFLFANIDDLKTKKYRTELLSSDMEIPNDRYLEHSAKDFFYLLARDPLPPAVSIKSTGWVASAGAQPPPAWIPGVFETEATTKEGAVTLVAVEPQRAAYRIRRGTSEPDTGAGTQPAPAPLDEADAARVLFATGVGVAHEKRPRGLVVKGRTIAGARAAAGMAMLVSQSGSLAIRKHEEVGELGPESDAVELPLLVDGAETFAHVAPAGVPMRSALGITPEGRVVVARARGNADAQLAEALRAAGCTRAVVLDRGARAQGTFDRTGTASAPRASYDETVIYGIARAMKPRAFRFEAQTEVAAAPKPTETRP